MISRKCLTGIFAAVCSIGMAGISSTANAQYTGPGQVKVYSNVANILKNPVDDVPVTLHGKLGSQFSGKYYEFNDGTGTIRAEIHKKAFAYQKVDANTPVEISGKVDTRRTKVPKIKVKRLKVIHTQ